MNTLLPQIYFRIFGSQIHSDEDRREKEGSSRWLSAMKCETSMRFHIRTLVVNVGTKRFVENNARHFEMKYLVRNVRTADAWQ